LNTAKKEGTKFEPELITDAGKQFISAGVSSSNPDIWNAVLAFVDYRSFLNSSLAPATDKFAPRDKEPLPWKFEFPLGFVKPGEVVHLLTGRTVAAESAAVLEPIGSRLNIDLGVRHLAQRI
jgi:hypothetical protein